MGACAWADGRTGVRVLGCMGQSLGCTHTIMRTRTHAHRLYTRGVQGGFVPFVAGHEHYPQCGVGSGAGQQERRAHPEPHRPTPRAKPLCQEMPKPMQTAGGDLVGGLASVHEAEQVPDADHEDEGDADLLGQDGEVVQHLQYPKSCEECGPDHLA